MHTRDTFLAVSLAAACSVALAGTEYGTVISSRAVTAQVSVPQQQCTEQWVAAQPPASGGGALLGAVIGGVLGHSLGEGMGRAAATGLGVVAGSVIGDRAESDRTPASTVPVRSCQTVSTVEQRIVGYDVTYDYAGQRYVTRMAQDPGDRIALNVSVAPQQAAVSVAPVTTVAPVIVSAPAVVTSVYPMPYGGPYVYGSPYAYAYGAPMVPHVGLVVSGGYWRRR